MRKIIAALVVSLDGFIEGPHGVPTDRLVRPLLLPGMGKEQGAADGPLLFPKVGVAQRAPLDASALSRCGGPGRSRAQAEVGA
jgi:hypothetical protein